MIEAAADKSNGAESVAKGDAAEGPMRLQMQRAKPWDAGEYPADCRGRPRRAVMIRARKNGRS